MALKSVYSAADDIPAEHKAFYKEDGDKFVLDIDGIDDHPKVRGVITANRENIRKRDEYKAKVTELESRVSGLPEDFDADEWARLKAGEGGKPDEAIQALKDQHARAIEALKQKHAGELSAKDQQIGERDSYIDRTLADGGLKDALLEVGVDPDLLDGALASLRPNVKVQRSDDGNRKAIVETDLGEIGVPEFVKEWAAGKGKAYLGKPSGPGAEGNNGNSRGKNLPAGNFGGDKGERTKAIAAKFPELAQG
ncbi:hypothetical protein SAMN02982989_3400 [Xaviernesmea oryzae]|uniref:Uncharacterized protein n=1 Tax=Xaviernesmea oryzae TaxID=464029 RepID=A0A1X7G9D3_9HYPH|nr:hypothetical protein [Xaviernesmea oryzae]SMF65747.1 hypothetical protein SAMN02982989_3400 [Xaviernesmea oryzae]